MELWLKEEDIKAMNRFDTMGSEATFYTLPGKDKFLFKIYSSDDEEYLYGKSNKIDILQLFNKEEKISELVLPKVKIYIDGMFKGELLKRIKGYNGYNYLSNNNISLSKKIDVLKKIGVILKKIEESNPRYSACFSDVHGGNFMIDYDGNVHAIDTTGMGLLGIPGTTNLYTYYLAKRNISKYEANCYGIMNTSKQTDIYCYVMMIVEVLLNNKNVFSFETDIYKSLIELLDKIGFDSRLVASLSSVMDNDAKNINPFIYLDTIEEEKVKRLRKSFDTHAKIRRFEY